MNRTGGRLALTAALLLSAPLLAQTAVSGTAADSQAADTAAVVDAPLRAGLGAAFHAGRRAALLDALEPGVVVIRGLPATRDYREFEQDKNFWYLTGVNGPGATLVMDVETRRALLYLPARDAVHETLEGELWDASDAWAPRVSGMRVKSADTLLADLAELFELRDTAWVSQLPEMTRSGSYDRAVPADRALRGDPLDGRLERARTLAQRLTERFGVTVRDMGPALAELRLRKQPEELQALRDSARIGALAMAEAIRSTRPGLSETAVEGVLHLIWRLHGATGPAYLPIVVSGPRNVVLHGAATAREMAAGELLLVDAGCESGMYTTDITRTWPVSGRFSERQAELYDAVLAAQAAGIAAVRPGVTLMDVDEAASAVLRQRGFGRLIRHFTCHWVGLEVHDVGNFFAPLEPGMVLTVEPGLYDEEAGVGVRIEDVVVVTEDGCENLTRDVPVTAAAMEALVAEPGVLDALVERR